MSFIFSKLLVVAIRPLTWIIVLLLMALFSKRMQCRKYYLIATICTLLFFTNQFIASSVAKLYEAEYPALKTYDYGILLGGFSGKNLRNNEIEFHDSADRFLQTYRLYKEGAIAKILISSGSANLFVKGPKEADDVATYLRKTGVPDSAVLVESNSRNTRENLLYSFKLINNKDARILIITSAWHIPRTKLLLKEMGYSNVDFYPTNFLSNSDYQWNDYLIPDVQALDKWTLLIKEWVGCIAIKIGVN
ncbi:YdcF family protein [Pedobacter montanisoli]|uniref:YdcF family protein n=1 Tax=Pedobacter montanisoli TaxID=2923277 RepID=A0ABS9ZUD9_9SPHI|nr:YdcF family protein [Pedobacter montanisoli]MCJ0741173.1 YdcF family protein [Pedobacter montanisoli]